MWLLNELQLANLQNGNTAALLEHSPVLLCSTGCHSILAKVSTSWKHIWAHHHLPNHIQPLPLTLNKILNDLETDDVKSSKVLKNALFRVYTVYYFKTLRTAYVILAKKYSSTVVPYIIFCKFTTSTQLNQKILVVAHCKKIVCSGTSTCSHDNKPKPFVDNDKE